MDYLPSFRLDDQRLVANEHIAVGDVRGLNSMQFHGLWQDGANSHLDFGQFDRCHFVGCDILAYRRFLRRLDNNRLGILATCNHRERGGGKQFIQSHHRVSFVSAHRVDDG